jgi:hypothetical protein
VGVQHFFGALQGFGDAGFVEGLEDVVNCVYIEGLDGVVVEGCGEDDLGDGESAFEEFFYYAEAVEAGHLNVQEDKVGLVFFYEVDGFQAVLAQGDYVYFGEAFQEVEEFVAGWALVVNYNCVDWHVVVGSSICNGVAGGKKSNGWR